MIPIPTDDLSLIPGEIQAILNLSLEEALESCKDKTIIHPDWSTLAGRIKMFSIRKNAPSSFSESTKSLKPILDPDYCDFVIREKSVLDKLAESLSENDWKYDIFAVETMLKSYLARIRKNNETLICETPQYMYLRVATYMWYPDMNRIESAFKDMSNGLYTHASPTLFNAGLFRSALSSCFLLTVDDSISSISKSWHDCAVISMNNGGIGIDMCALRHSEIGQYGFSKGIVPWIKILNEILCTVDQGGKRKGSGAVYIEPWHLDIYEFLELKKAEGSESMRARDLFYALWICDLFMERVEKNEEWTLFCPNKAPGLDKRWGVEFEMLYLEYEQKAAEGKIASFRKVKARDLWQKIIMTQITTGMPYICFKDACNRKSNQQNMGTIRSSNLCSEIIEYSDEKNIASCNLASIAVNSCVREGGYDFHLLSQITANLVRNLNQVIDRNFYPKDVPEIRYTNFRTRPMGIGIQGLSDTFAMLDIPWSSEEAKKLNSEIMETIYYAAVRESVELAKELGPYETFEGSPASKGKFQFDLWESERKEKVLASKPELTLSDVWPAPKAPGTRYTLEEWNALRKDMVKFGLRNSLLIALMPTASSASILGNNECFEPHTQHIYARTVLSGQFVIMNRHLVHDFEKMGLWNDDTVSQIIDNKGSISNYKPPEGVDVDEKRLAFLKEKYKTVFELSQKHLLDMSLDRGKYVCQSQSLNCWLKEASFPTLNAYLFRAWKGGAKTGLYYLRQMAREDPLNIAKVSKNTVKEREDKKPKFVCTDDVCVMCSS